MNTVIKLKCCLIVLLCAFSNQVLSDGTVVDKVYHPYVIANEREIEWRLLSSESEDSGNLLVHRLGIGFSVAENVAIETYIIGERDEQQNFDISAFEIEARWMITDQGKYWADWGALFELERNTRLDSYEFTAGVISEKEYNQTSLTVNLFVIYETGEQLESEFEAEFRAKFRYRYIPQLQPGIELYAGEDFIGVGPALMGIHRFVGQKQIKWEAGFITEISKSNKDQSFRVSIEYEF